MVCWTDRHRLERFWRLGLVTLTAILPLAGCGSLASPSARATVTPTATSRPLVWQIALAPGNGLATGAYVPAPSDGRITYACGGSVLGAVVWSTHTRGASWSDGVKLPYAGYTSSCALTVDANDSQRLIAALDTARMGASPGPLSIVAFMSQDGGATWQAMPLAGPHSVYSLAAFDGTVYASGAGLSPSGVPTWDVWASRDGGRSWRALEAASLQGNPLIWVNPRTGELVGTNNLDLLPTLWHSADGGASWTRIAVPDLVGSGGSQGFLVAPNGAGWRICVAGQSAPSQQQANALACSENLGGTWMRPPALNPAQFSPKGFTFTAPVQVFAIADDGTLLASYDDLTDGPELEALAPGGRAWASLGTLTSAIVTAGTPPDVGNAVLATVAYTSGPGEGMLWSNVGDPAHPFITAGYP